MFGSNLAVEVKISDQYVNILSILRGKAVNIQYQYLEGRESIFIQSLSLRTRPRRAMSQRMKQRRRENEDESGKNERWHEGRCENW